MRTSQSSAWVVLLLVGAACARPGVQAVPARDPQQVVDELLAADREFSARSAQTDAVGGIAAMLAADVTMPTTQGGFARTATEAADALRIAFGPAAVRAEWTPIRGGISADGQHGFTFGYMTLYRRDTASTPLKYLSYWVKQPAGWRVAAYKLGRRPAGAISLSTMPAALPPASVRPTLDSATIARHTASLIAAERAFSDRAQQIGLGAAFTEYGSADAINLGGRDSPSFVVGAEAIGRLVSRGRPPSASPVSWSADRAIVASSGDLGVTFGFILPNPPAAEGGRGAGVPFFTIWRRPTAASPWRYVAE